MNLDVSSDNPLVLISKKSSTHLTKADEVFLKKKDIKSILNESDGIIDSKKYVK